MNGLCQFNLNFNKFKNQNIDFNHRRFKINLYNLTHNLIFASSQEFDFSIFKESCLLSTPGIQFFEWITKILN